MEQIVNWRYITDTEFSIDGSSSIMAVGTGVLDPMNGTIDRPELNLKSVCPYFNGTFAVGEWKIFVEQFDIEQMAEVTMDKDVNGCAYAKDKNGSSHFYMTTSDGEVYYGKEMGTFTKIGKINTGLNGVKHARTKSSDNFIFYGKNMIAIIPVDTCAINPTKFEYYRDDINFIHADICEFNYSDKIEHYIIALDDTNTVVIRNIDLNQTDTEFKCFEIQFPDIIKSILRESSGLLKLRINDIDFPENLSINNILYHENIVYLLCDKGYIGSFIIQDLLQKIDGEYTNLNSLSLIKFTSTHWHDMIHYDDYFIGVGEGRVNESFFKISNLNEMIHSYDLLHNMSCTRDYKDLCYLTDYAKINDKNEFSYNSMIISKRVRFKIDENYRPWIYMDDIYAGIEKNSKDPSDFCNFINDNVDISIMPMYAHTNSVYDTTIIAELYKPDSQAEERVRLIMPNMNANVFEARVTIIIPTRKEEFKND